MTSKASLRSLGRILLLFGGIVLILGSVLDLAVDIRGLVSFTPNVPSLGPLTGLLVGILIGVLALVGAGQVKSPAWGIVLLIVGFLEIQSLGGILVFVGAIVALVAAFVKT